MTADLVAVEVDGPVCTLRLVRPEKLNALSSAMETQLLDALAAEQVRRSRCVLVTGGPRVFSAGADVTELGGLDPAAIFDYYERYGRVYEVFADLPMPTIAVINGYCLGGGLELALAADFRVAGASARFGFPEVGIGIVPSSGGFHRVVRMVGPAKARELVLLRERFDAQEALALGLVTEVVADAVTMPRARELAARLVALPQLASTIALRCVDMLAESSRPAGLLLERLAYGMLGQTPEAQSPDA